MVHSKSQATHLGFLDGVRGIAALWVVLAHCMIWGWPHDSPLPNPLYAVDIFMVLSGYLMVYQANVGKRVQDQKAMGFAKHFYIRRFFRIAPLYYLVLIFVIFFGAGYKSGLANLQAALPERWIGADTYLPKNIHYTLTNLLMHFSLLFGIFPRFGSSMLLPDWSIGLEIQFYAIFPACLWLLRRRGPLQAGLLMWILSIGIKAWVHNIFGLHGFAEPSFLPLRFEVFLAGMLAAASQNGPRNSRYSASLAIALAVIVAEMQSGYVLGVVCIMLLLGHGGGKIRSLSLLKWILSKLLGNRVMGFLADTSYAVYLVHGFFISLAGGWMYSHPQFMQLDPRTRVLALIAVTLAGTFPIAWLLHRFVEKPGIQLGRSITQGKGSSAA
jgi:peptidoglycan/LPS O-acetylase OafA/YrhL